MCILELVDFNEAMQGTDAAKPKASRRRRSTKKTAGDEAKTGKTAAAKAKKTTREPKETKKSGSKTDDKE
jgi:hypothetical protein